MSSNPYKVGDSVIIKSMHLGNKYPHKVTKILEDMVEVLGEYFYYTELRLATREENRQNLRLWK